MADLTTAPVPPAVRDHLALALDVDDLVMARRLATAVRPWFGVAKVGLELFSAVGPDAIGVMRNMGYRVFLDVKLHDIPTTVGRAARVFGALGVDLLTLHTAGGAAMVRAGVEGLAEGAHAAGLDQPVALGVTVLTSDADAPPELLTQRVFLALAAGCGGVVCAAADLPAVRTAPGGDAVQAVVPGIRPAGGAADDQARVATPAAAIAAGADLLVIGRPVTRAADPAAAAAAVAAEVASAFSR